MRILLHLGYPGLLRLFGSTVRELAGRGHEVLLAYDLRDKKRSAAAAELEALPNVRVLDPVPWDGSGSPADLHRRTADYLRYLDRRLASTPYARRLEGKTPAAALEFARSPLAPVLARPYLRALVWRDRFRPPDRANLEYMRAAAPDAIVVSPLVSRGQWGARQTETVKSAKELAIPVAAAIASWDHLTTKGIIKVVPDRVLVWNEAQRLEAQRLHRVPRRRVVVTGAQAFDQWFAKEPSASRAELAASVGLDPARPYVLYVGSSPNITPVEEEIAFVREWRAHLRAAGPPLAELGCLVRPHPGNVEGWAAVDHGPLGLAVAPRERPGIPMSPADEALYFDSIHHSAAVVGINTSAILEALIQRRPVFTISTPQFAQEDTLHFRHLVPDGGGCVRLARTLEEHCAQLRAALEAPGRQRDEIERFVRSFVRPHGLDREATPIVADAIESLAALPHRRPIATRLAFSGNALARRA